MKVASICSFIRIPIGIKSKNKFTDHDRYACFPCNGYDGIVVGHGELRVRNTLAEDQLRTPIDQALTVPLGEIGEPGSDPEARQQTIELRVGPTVQVPRGDNVVPRFSQRHHDHEDRGGTGRCRYRINTILQCGHSLLEDFNRRLRKVGE